MGRVYSDMSQHAFPMRAIIDHVCPAPPTGRLKQRGWGDASQIFILYYHNASDGIYFLIQRPLPLKKIKK